MLYINICKIKLMNYRHLPMNANWAKLAESMFIISEAVTQSSSFNAYMILYLAPICIGLGAIN